MPQVVASAKAIIQNNDKYLIIKEKLRDYEVFDLPGGKIEYGETPEEALKREVFEETRLSIDIQKQIGVWWFTSQQYQYQAICTTYLCFPLPNFKIDLSFNPANEDICEYFWLSKLEILNKFQDKLPASLLSLFKTL